MRLLFGKGAMSSETFLRQEIRDSLGFVRGMIDHYSGLYSGENLTRDVLRLCDEMTTCEEPNPRLKEARRIVEERCRQLAQATDRFAQRDPASIAAIRAQAVAAIDAFQDAAFEWRKARTVVPSAGRLLRRKSL
jgi:CRISPR/Cas system-associated endonuclease Cas1